MGTVQCNCAHARGFHWMPIELISLMLVLTDETRRSDTHYCVLFFKSLGQTQSDTRSSEPLSGSKRSLRLRVSWPRCVNALLFGLSNQQGSLANQHFGISHAYSGTVKSRARRARAVQALPVSDVICGLPHTSMHHDHKGELHKVSVANSLHNRTSRAVAPSLLRFMPRLKSHEERNLTPGLLFYDKCPLNRGLFGSMK